MTREEALGLGYGDWIYHRRVRQGSKKDEPFRVRVTGRVRTWKRDPARIEVPAKWGMRSSFTITADDLADWFLTEAEAQANSPAAHERQKRARYAVEPHGRCVRAGYCVDHEADPRVEPCDRGPR